MQIHILWLLLFLQITQLSLSLSLRLGNETDMQSLLAFKAQISNDPLGVLSSWNQSSHFCQWSGVTCGRRHQRVVELRLNSSKLQGSLSPHVGNLSFLRVLFLHRNSFTDHIPQELGRLLRLRRLRLSNNTFTGVIPVNISRCSNLLWLDLQDNNLTGKVPAELGILTKLEVLYFGRNNLLGEIPTSLGNLSSLLQLDGRENNLQGVIPISIGQLKSLSTFTFDSNNLTGTIPASIYNISSLTIYSLLENNFHGKLPPNLFQNLPNLQSFSISDNQFSGEIPISLSNASQLAFLQLVGNNFIGKVPTMSGLHNLWQFSVDDNFLGGEEEADDLSFLYSLANNSNLEILGMSGNNFRGVLPEIVSNFSRSLRRITMGRNQIHGVIPTNIGNLISLEVLGFETNNLTGIIPTSIGNLQNLKILTMGGNKITGTIPSSLGNITSLIGLDLSWNKLLGTVPSSLGNCQNLLQLFLNGNQLSGYIPKEVIGISSLSQNLDLSANRFTGILPIEVGKLVKLGYIDISDNNLLGTIPTSLGSCISLERLYLGGNFFQGSIPESLSSLKAIQHLNISHNNLTGEIPKFFEDYKLLEDLDLSFNNLDGEVPIKGVFENANGVLLFGNKNLCGGIPELKLSKCSFHESRKGKSSIKLLLIIIVSSVCFGIIFIVCFLCFYYRREEKKFSSPSFLEKFFRRITYEELCQATDGFSSSNLISTGSFGSVYKGILHPDGIVIAIKVLNLLRKEAFKSFIAECEVLPNIRHRNLVKVLSACSSIDSKGNDFKAIVYELMVNGNLDEWLHPIHTTDQTNESRNLNLLQRLNIALDVANALDYLHNHSKMAIVHCDLKPSNVLLDDDMTAHVGDFGIARFLQEVSHQSSSNPSSSIGLKGTIGYAAPEYGIGNEVSTHGDIYSFGIILLEMFIRKKPTDNMFKDGMNLHNFTKAALPYGVLDIVDPILLKEHEEASAAASRNHSGTHHFIECMISVLKIAVACSAELPRDRMDISNAAVELLRIRDLLLRTEMQRQEEIIALRNGGASSSNA